jgi:hypothetical protein
MTTKLLSAAIFISVVLVAPSLVADTPNDFRLKLEAIEEPFRNGHVAAAAYADGSFQVLIRDENGTPLFESAYPIRKSDGNYLEWTYRSKPPISRSNLIGPEVAPTLRGMTFAAKDIVRMVGKGLAPGSQNRTPRTDDTFGCDLPQFVDIECTNRGNCCDRHDECYWAYDCSYWSWLGVSNIFCEGCNAGVVACITLGIGSTGTPSACCDQGNCGQERCQGLYWNDPNCSPRPIKPSIAYRTPAPDPGTGGGGPAGNGDIPGGGVGYGTGTCCFPDGTCLSCG